MQPTPGLHLAMDPRIPDELEAFRFQLALDRVPRRVEWFVDGKVVARTSDASYAWPLAPGEHTVRARVWLGNSPPSDIPPVTYLVK